MFSLLRFRFRVMAAATAAVLCVPVPASGADGPPAPKAPVPAVSWELEKFGYRPTDSRLVIEGGYANVTVNFIDAQTLLLTFSAKRLLKRLPDQREEDEDHAMVAEVIRVSDGKVLRQAEFRLHDHRPYLWPLANGRFLMRVRNDLYTLDPMGAYEPDRLGERLLLRSNAELQSVQFSPERGLLLLETMPERRIGDDPAEAKNRPVTATFYRVKAMQDGALVLERRGRAEAHSVFSIAFTSLGLLETVKEDRLHWGFDFHPYVGKPIELAGFTSSCRPHAVFISETEFFAYGCRGGEDRKLMGGFNLLAEAKWVLTTDDEPLWMAMDASTSTGRFALRNTLTTVDVAGNDQLVSSEIRMQEVRVYGGREGEELLRVETSPSQKPAGNFALSPDGLKLAVMRGRNLEIYNLPPIPAADARLHEKERAALQTLRAAEDVDIAAAVAGATSSNP